jgi:hypothetical protein
MTDDLYERYKEALRIGHVAVLRGALDEAVEAYRTAAKIAPSRALPRTSLGGVLLRQGRLDEALAEYSAAVVRAPNDEGALLGQADALTTAGRRNEAATVLDHVAEIQVTAGRLPEATDTLRRALEMEELPERIRRQRALLREIRLSAGDKAAEKQLARALRLRDEPVGEPAAAQAVSPAPVIPAEPAPTFEPVPPVEPFTPIEPEPELVEALEPVVAAAVEQLEPAAVRPVAVTMAPEMVEAVAMETSAAVSDAEALQAEAVAAEKTNEFRREVFEEVGPEPELLAALQAFDQRVVGVMAGAEGTVRPSGAIRPGSVPGGPDEPTGDQLLAAAEAADEAGDEGALRSLLLWTARTYARESRFEAALDATHRLLARVPADVDGHLLLVELYVARKWDSLAADKLALLGRIAELNDDQETRKRLVAVASRAFPDDQRLGSLYS